LIGMAHLDLFHPENHPRRTTLRSQLDRSVQRTQRMLVAAAVSTMAVVAIAALMMARI
jgi:hypothetical protein